MKIFVADSVRKFTDEIINHWKEQGHEIIIDRYFDPVKVEWSDVTFFEFVDNSLMRASDPGDSLWKDKHLTQTQGKNIIARAHDLDVHTGNLLRINWAWVKHLVFVNDFHKKLTLNGIPDLEQKTNVHVINHGVNLDKFTLKKEFKRGNKIAWIGNINHQKQPELSLQILANFPAFELHICGTGWRNWQKGWADDFIKRNNLKVFFYDRVDNINDFLEDKDFLLSTSIKEAFGFAIAEAASKGVRPIVYNFWGADNVWPKEWIWNNMKELADMLYTKQLWDETSTREFVKNRYPLDKMLDEYDKLLLP